MPANHDTLIDYLGILVLGCAMCLFDALYLREGLVADLPMFEHAIIPLAHYSNMILYEIEHEIYHEIMVLKRAASYCFPCSGR